MPRVLKRFACPTLVLLCFAAVASAQHRVSGVARYSGPPVKRLPIKMTADPKCAELSAGETVLAGDLLVGENHGVANVFVYVRDGADLGADATASEPVALKQRGCWYRPRVQGILVNQPLKIFNDDPTLHNVRSLAKSNRPFNLGQPPDLPPREKTFPLAEPAIKFKCDVHPWMEAYLFVMDHPYFAVTDGEGRFAITGLPAGQHTLVAWHETLGRHQIEIDVKADVGDANFTYMP